MTHGIEPDEPSKSCPYSRKDEVARHRSARADRSLYAGFLISETPIRLTNPQPNRPNQDNLPPMRLNEGRAHKHQALLASVLEGGFKVEVVPSQERL
jgi:hypothetical protein